MKPNIKQLKQFAKNNNLKLLPLMENLTKKDVYVVVDTPKKAKKLKKVLDMFGEKTDFITIRDLKEFKAQWITQKKYKPILLFDDSERDWIGGWEHHAKKRFQVSIKKLRTILAKEHLKAGDYFVDCNKYVFVLNKINEDNTINCSCLTHNTKGDLSYEDFKRYATPEEIDLLDGKKELEIWKWYKTTDDSHLFLHQNGFYSYGFQNGKWTTNWRTKLSDWKEQGYKVTEATPQEVESALIEEAKRRYKFGDKLIDVNGVEIVPNGSYFLYYGVLYYGGATLMKDGKWAEVIKNDEKFAELKEAHKNGAVIEYRHASPSNAKWFLNENPAWNPYFECRIRPEEKPNVVWKESLIREANNYEIATNQLVNLCHGLAKDAGWHDKPREVGTMLALIHSEVSEAMEGFRKDLNDDHLTHRKMSEVELADAVIRIFDLAGAQGFDLGGALVEKLVYNTQRADHKIENRQGENGKKF